MVANSISRLGLINKSSDKFSDRFRSKALHILKFFHGFFLCFRDKLAENGVRVRVIGNIALLPEDLTKIIYEIELLTRNNKTALLNVAFAYTGINFYFCKN